MNSRGLPIWRYKLGTNIVSRFLSFCSILILCSFDQNKQICFLDMVILEGMFFPSLSQSIIGITPTLEPQPTFLSGTQPPCVLSSLLHLNHACDLKTAHYGKAKASGDRFLSLIGGPSSPGGPCDCGVPKEMESCNLYGGSHDAPGR